MRKDTRRWLLVAAQAWGIPAAADAEIGPGVPRAPVLLELPPFRAVLFDPMLTGSRPVVRRHDEPLKDFADRAWSAAGPSVRAWQRAGCLALAIDARDVDADPDAVMERLTNLRYLLTGVWQGLISADDVAKQMDTAA